MVEKLLISKNRVKSYLQKLELRVSEEFYPALDLRIKTILSEVAKRTKDNRRSTVLAKDA